MTKLSRGGGISALDDKELEDAVKSYRSLIERKMNRGRAQDLVTAERTGKLRGLGVGQ